MEPMMMVNFKIMSWKVAKTVDAKRSAMSRRGSAEQWLTWSAPMEEEQVTDIHYLK